MSSPELAQKMQSRYRSVELAHQGDEDLGPLKLLPGVWKNGDRTRGRGWNMIALPFATEPDSRLNYRLLVNQYEETLQFTTVDKAVPNRGIQFPNPASGDPTQEMDQFVVTLDYQQSIAQLAAEDRPDSGKAGPADLAIHHEPGLFLHMTDFTTADLDVARLGTVPHGDSLLGLGTADTFTGPPTIPAVDGLPEGATKDLDSGYLAPYRHYHDNPFKGTVPDPGFPGFDPVHPHLLLQGGMPGNVVRTTVLPFNTQLEDAGIVNIPFIVKQANAAVMDSIFWILELDEPGVGDEPKLMMMYLQNVGLDFFPRFDDLPGLIRWPHVSINVMEKVAPPEEAEPYTLMPAV
ncbi:heme-binding protein [Ruegeria sp.]|uniref:heme-binding protein n=1 Tax=Ruegeria sp. TaxID=1879320 RepID=UPI0023125AF4|nr:heme-binding protein [Ruegeria sp.]MDA7965831.1 heme-binding protein [Ruegeria sp.]